jgi:adenine-specific DNA-methyltransferase
VIEGDNFDALRYLRMTHAGKVKCIYIDPPYNTGNKDFIYNDSFVDKDDLYRHSKWLEYMYRRLEIARDLLTEDGVIFVSIGEDEIHELGLLLNHIFSGLQRIATLVWRTRQSSDSRNQTGVSIDHEYVLCFGTRLRGIPVDEDKFSNPDNDHRGAWRSADMTGLATKDKRPNLHYDLENPETKTIYPCPPKGWRYEPKTMKRLIAEKQVLWPANANGRPRLKKFLKELKSTHKGFSSILDVPFTSEGGKELAEVDLSNKFSFPKPSGLIKTLINQVCNPDDIVLDFFAGSGTTAKAVLDLNKEDDGNRTFILVSSTEATADEKDKNICKDVCASRIERSGGDFAYLRARRIPIETIFTKIQHDQVWSALQLIHAEMLTPYQKNAPFQSLESNKGNDAALVIYLPKITEVALEELKKKIKKGKEVVIYSWQPALMKERFEKPSVTVEPIPQFLVDRFGAGAKK